MTTTLPTSLRPVIAALSCAVAAFALTACGGGEPDPTSTAAQGNTVSGSPSNGGSGVPTSSGEHAPGVTVDPSATIPNNAEALGVDVRRVGGIAGSNDRLVMDEMGKVTMSSKTSPVKLCTIEPAFVEKLGVVVSTKGKTGSAKVEHPDQQLLTVTYHGKTMKAAAPALEQAVVDRLVRILDLAAKNETGKSAMCP